MEVPNRERIQEHLVKARKKLAVSEKLLTSGDWEDAVSRAFCAAAHAARAMLLAVPAEVTEAARVVPEFEEKLVATGRMSRRQGRILANLAEDAESADADACSYVDQEIAEAAVDDAREFVTEAERSLEGEADHG